MTDGQDVDFLRLPNGPNRRGSSLNFLQTGSVHASSSRRSSVTPRHLELRRGTRDKLAHLGQGSQSQAAPSEQITIATERENTYQLGPTDNQRFREGEVRKKMNDVMQVAIEGEKYDKHKAPRLACYISQAIKDSLKESASCRHKICCFVVLGENTQQDLNLASQCLWAPEVDRSVTVTARSNNLFAVATVYGVYCE